MPPKSSRRARRVWILLGVFAALIAVGASSPSGLDGEASVPSAQSPPVYVSSTQWRGMPPSFEARLISIDQALWSAEVNENRQAVIAQIAALMSQPGQESYRKALSLVVAETGRSYAFSSLLPSLAISISTLAVRLSIVADLSRVLDTVGPSAFLPETVATIKQINARGTEPHAAVSYVLIRLANRL